MSSSDASSPELHPLVGAVVVAAGEGRRMGGVRKQYLPLAGRPVLEWSLRAFLDHPGVSVVVAVLPPEDVATPPAWLRDLPVELAAGGRERADSVRSGLERLPAGTATVLVHDGARPLVSREVVDRVLAGAARGAVLPVVPVSDTVKEVDPRGRVERTVDRANLRLAQTPQGFPLEALRRAHARALREGWAVTDDALLFERCGWPVRVVEGAAENLKITGPSDLSLAERLLRGAGPRPA